MTGPVSISMPGFAFADSSLSVQPSQDDPNPGESIIYTIPPAAWVLVFLLVGYVGIRLLMED